MQNSDLFRNGFDTALFPNMQWWSQEIAAVRWDLHLLFHQSTILTYKSSLKSLQFKVRPDWGLRIDVALAYLHLFQIGGICVEGKDSTYLC